MKYICSIILLALSWSASGQTDGFNYQKPLFDFDYAKPTFKLEGEQLSNANKLLRYTLLSGYREGVKPINGTMGMKMEVFRDTLSGTTRIAMYNLSVKDMLTGGVLDDQIVWKVRNVFKYHYQPAYGDENTWLRKNGYCYEFVFPSEVMSPALLLQMRKDIASQFGLKIVLEKVEDPIQHGAKMDLFTISEIN